MNYIDLMFEIFPILETNRFILRQVKDGDCGDIYDIYSEKEAVKYQQTNPMTTIEQAKKSVEAFLRGFNEKRFIRWCITEKEADKVLGLITLNNFDRNNSSATIGYMLNKRYWRKNIMSEVGEKVINYGFKTLNLHRIEASIHPDNIASIKLCSKLGFLEEGLRKESAYNIATDGYEDRLIFGIVNN